MKIVISSHIWVTGPCHELKKYLLRRNIDKLLYITHPLKYHQRLKGSGYEVYENGHLKKESYNKIRKIPAVLSYFKDFILNILYVIKSKERYEIYIGFDNLNAFSGWILKKIGKVKKCVYYVVDYTPKRFDNNVLNLIYHKIESFCAIRCDETWNLSLRMIDAREKFKGIKRETCGIQKVVPMGIWFDEIRRYKFDKINKYQLAFMGHILKKQGVQYVLDAIPLIIIKEIPDFKFLVIGDGKYLNDLRNKVKELNIEKHVEFTGYVEKHKDIEDMIAKSAVAIALYERGDRKRNWTYYADPGKIKVYLGCGVPVLLTDVPPNAKEIEENKCGKIVDLDPQSIAKAVVEMMKDKNTLRVYRENAIKYAQRFDWENMLDRVFRKVLFDIRQLN